MLLMLLQCLDYVLLNTTLIGGYVESLQWLLLAFLPQNFRRWWGPTNGTLTFYECRFSGGDPQTLPYEKEFV